MSQIASSTRLAICAEVKDILLSVTEVVSDTNAACGEQSVDRLSKCLTQDCLARDTFFVNSAQATGKFSGDSKLALGCSLPISGLRLCTEG